MLRAAWRWRGCVLALSAALVLFSLPGTAQIVVFRDFQPQCHFQTPCVGPAAGDRTFGTSGLGGGSYNP